MNRRIFWGSLLRGSVVLGMLLVARSHAAAADRFAWRTASPESQGMISSRLHAMQEELARRGTKAVLVARHDRIVVRFGNNLAKESEGLGFWGGIEHYLFNPVIEAVANPGS